MRTFLRRMAICASYDLQWKHVTRDFLPNLGEGLKEGLIGLFTLVALPFYAVLYFPAMPLRWALAVRKHGEQIDKLGFRPKGKKADPGQYQ